MHVLLTSLTDLDEVIHVHVGVSEGPLERVSGGQDPRPFIVRLFREFLSGSEIPGHQVHARRVCGPSGSLGG